MVNLSEADLGYTSESGAKTVQLGKTNLALRDGQRTGLLGPNGAEQTGL
nr:hypothetical protein [Marinomonas pontica]